MNARFRLLLVLLLMSAFVSCDDNSVCVCPDDFTIAGLVVYSDSQEAVQNALVFITFDGPEGYSDTTVTDLRGAYSFNDIPEGYFILSAAIPDSAVSESCSHRSAVSSRLNNTGDPVFCPDNIILFEVFDQSSITGQVVHLHLPDLPDLVYLPVDSADVVLFSVSGVLAVAVDSVLSDVDGNYSFENVSTGSYLISVFRDGEYGETDEFFCDGASAFTVDQINIAIYARKPAIYIYPAYDESFNVTLEFLNGTELTESVPEYGSGWDVFVETSGRIDDLYDYLFYEASVHVAPSLSEGWCISRDGLPGGLGQHLLEMGLNDTEVADFLEYWLEALMDYEYYFVYPLVDDSLDQFVHLHIDPEPDARLRVWLFFEGTENPLTLTGPSVTGFQRGSTTVIEWGGVLLN